MPAVCGPTCRLCPAVPADRDRPARACAVWHALGSSRLTPVEPINQEAMRLMLCTALVAAVGLGMAAPARSQSLGDVARKEEERRKDVKSPAKVYTNKDLGAPLQGGSPDAAKPEASPSERSKDAAKAGDGKAKDKDGPDKDQAYWVKHKKDLQDKLERSKTQLDAMQSRINALTADFTSRDDPVQRAAIERDRQRALSELARLQQDIKDTQKALTDLDEEARKAGVPPGWLR